MLRVKQVLALVVVASVVFFVLMSFSDVFDASPGDRSVLGVLGVIAAVIAIPAIGFLSLSAEHDKNVRKEVYRQNVRDEARRRRGG